MSNPYTQKQLHYMRQLQAQLEAHKTKASSIHFRKKVLDRQKVANYQNEYDRLMGLMGTSNLGHTTKAKLQRRTKELESLGAMAVQGIQ